VKLLGEAVERVKALRRGETPHPPASAKPAVTIDLPLTAYLPESYIPDLNLRLAVYQRLARAETNPEVDAIDQELVDRFGPQPQPARNLLWVVRLRILATSAGIGALQTEDGQLVIRMLPGRGIDRSAMSRRLDGVAWVGPHQVRLDRDALGQGWREALVRTIDALAGAATVAV
jgi:transcription-repair coupling factor (superfamily II helicase)